MGQRKRKESLIQNFTLKLNMQGCNIHQFRYYKTRGHVIVMPVSHDLGLTALGEEVDDGVDLAAAVDLRELGGAVEGQVVNP